MVADRPEQSTLMSEILQSLVRAYACSKLKLLSGTSSDVCRGKKSICKSMGPNQGAVIKLHWTNKTMRYTDLEHHNGNDYSLPVLY